MICLWLNTMPTYAEIVSGTPKLSLVFELSSGFVPDKNLMVTQVGQNWNQLVAELVQWQSLGKDIITARA
jgi:hypothetical protein